MLSPTLILGDIYGSIFWKTAVAKSPNCRYVFLGDYLDAKDDIVLSKKLDNLQEIIQLKKENPENVVLLLGNYDLLHFDYEINKSVSLIFRENASLFQNAYQD
jgi:hypothetical protein